MGRSRPAGRLTTASTALIRAPVFDISRPGPQLGAERQAATPCQEAP